MEEAPPGRRVERRRPVASRLPRFPRVPAKEARYLCERGAAAAAQRRRPPPPRPPGRPTRHQPPPSQRRRPAEGAVRHDARARSSGRQPSCHGPSGRRPPADTHYYPPFPSSSPPPSFLSAPASPAPPEPLVPGPRRQAVVGEGAPPRSPSVPCRPCRGTRPAGTERRVLGGVAAGGAQEVLRAAGASALRPARRPVGCGALTKAHRGLLGVRGRWPRRGGGGDGGGSGGSPRQRPAWRAAARVVAAGEPESCGWVRGERQPGATYRLRLRGSGGGAAGAALVATRPREAWRAGALQRARWPLPAVGGGGVVAAAAAAVPASGSLPRLAGERRGRRGWRDKQLPCACFFSCACARRTAAGCGGARHQWPHPVSQACKPALAKAGRAGVASAAVGRLAPVEACASDLSAAVHPGDAGRPGRLDPPLLRPPLRRRCSPRGAPPEHCALPWCRSLATIFCAPSAHADHAASIGSAPHPLSPLPIVQRPPPSPFCRRHATADSPPHPPHP